MKTIVIGSGTIGAPLAEKLAGLGHEVVQVTRRKGVTLVGPDVHMHEGPSNITLDNMAEIQEVLDPFIEGVSVAFIAIPSTGKGEELAYIEYFRSRGVYVITTAKGAFADQYVKLVPHLDHIGRRAVVGGRVGMLPLLNSQHLRGTPVTMHFVANASNNDFFSRCAGGDSMSEAFRKVKLAGLAEPGAKDVVSFVNAELDDTMRKMRAIYNDCIADHGGPFVTSDDLPAPVPVTMEDLQGITLPSKNLRPLIRITSSLKLEPEFKLDSSGSMFGQFGEHQFSLGFYDLSRDVELAKAARGGAWNFVRVQHDDDGEGALVFGGIGAGPDPTIGSVMNDLQDLICSGRTYVGKVSGSSKHSKELLGALTGNA